MTNMLSLREKIFFGAILILSILAKLNQIYFGFSILVLSPKNIEAIFFVLIFASAMWIIRRRGFPE